MHTILIPTDFSLEAQNAARYAAELAKIFNSKLILFHVYTLPTSISEVPYVIITVDELQKENETMMRKVAEQLTEEFQIEPEWLVRIGTPSDEIKQLAEEKAISLIVMGMKGMGGIDQLIGSTTVNLLRKVKAPVLVIPKEAVFQPLKQITFGSDYNFYVNLHSFKPLVVLAKKFNSNIQIVHVQKTESSSSVMAEMEWKRTAENMLAGIAHSFITVTDDKIKHGLPEYIETHDTELLVMLTHQHSFLERLFNRSQTASMAYSTKIPLLVLHD